MDRNMLMAVILSMGVLLFWYGVVSPPQAPEMAPAPPVETEKQKPPGANDDGGPIFEEDKGISPGDTELLSPKGEKAAAETGEGKTEASPSLEEEKKPLPAEEFHVIETENFRAVFTSHGARIKSFILKGDKYSRKVKGSEERSQVDLVSTTRPENLPYTLLLDQPNFNCDTTGAWKVLAADRVSVTYELDSPQRITVTKRFALEKSYLFAIDLSITNGASEAASFFPQFRLMGFQDEADLRSGVMGSAALNLQIPKAFTDGELWEETDKEELLAGKVLKGHILWTAIDDRYFLLSLLPPEDSRSQIAVKNASKPSAAPDGGESKRHWLKITHSLARQRVEPGKTLTLNYRAYIGPKEYTVLKEVGNRFEETVDFWVLGFLAKPMLWVLQKAYSFVGNWGIAILILTLIVKILLHPLTYKSFKSMAKMKELKPKIDALKEKLGDDKQEFNKQMMELYKREGVNPLGGCLPVVLQMPVYIALYKMLQNSVELYNSPFIPGWLNDLVAPDPYYVLPVVLGLLMFVQQKLTPTPDSQQQKMMMYMMPAMMFFFMLMLPSGLVLYILANTVLSIGQQYWIQQKSRESKEPAKAG